RQLRLRHRALSSCDAHPDGAEPLGGGRDEPRRPAQRDRMALRVLRRIPRLPAHAQDRAERRRVCRPHAGAHRRDGRRRLRERAGQRLAECAQAQARGAEIYGQVSCQPLSHDFTLDNAYLMYSLDAWKPLQTADKDTIARTLRDPAFRSRYREGFKNPKKGLIFYGNWRMVDVAACAKPENLPLEGRSIADLAADRRADPVDVFFDLALEEDLATVFNAKVMNSDEKAVGELIRSKASVIAQSDAGAHLEFFCDAGFGLYMLGR